MLNKEAIDALQEGKSIENAYKAMAKAVDTNHLVMLPSDFKEHDLEKFQPVRRRARGAFQTNELVSFTAYTLAHAELGCSVFVNPAEMAATAVLNLGTSAVPGHTDNRAKLTAERTAAYKALRSICQGTHKQSTIAEFLEDWPDLITCFHGTEQLSPPKAIAAIRKITIEGLRKVESEEQQLSAQRSTFESVQATSTEKLPTLIYFKCQPYKDLDQREFVLRVNVHTGDSKPALSLRIVKDELHSEQMAQELATLVADKFHSIAPIAVHIGSYSTNN